MDTWGFFTSLYKAEFSFVWNFLRKLGVHDRDLEDVTHDVFVTIHRKLSEYDRDRPLRPWLTGFAVRAASDYRRLARHKRETFDHGGLEPVDESPGPEEQMEARQARHLVEQALKEVPFERRVVLVMHDLEGMTAPEIASILSILLNTVYSRLRIAREEFSAAVRRILSKRGQR